MLANIYGFWDAWNTFVDGLPPYVYEGDPYVAEHGVDYWSAVPYPLCTIADMVVGEASPCLDESDVFTQSLSFVLLNAPAAGDSIWVQDSLLVYDGNSPWDVVLSLPAIGDTIDITVTCGERSHVHGNVRRRSDCARWMWLVQPI